MSHNNQIDYIEFHATDVAATKQFYGEVFGWKFEDYGPEYSSFKDGRIAGCFMQGAVSTGTGPLVVIYVDDLASAEKRVVSAGGKITKETFTFPGGSRFHFTGPNGNELAAWRED